MGYYCRAGEFFGAMGTLRNDLWALILVCLGDGKHISNELLGLQSLELGEGRVPPTSMSNFLKPSPQYTHSTTWCRHSPPASFRSTTSSHPSHSTATNAQSSRKCPPSRYLAQVVGHPSSAFGQSTTRSLTMLATMMGAGATPSGFNGLRSTGHEGAHSRELAMHAAQNVWRHLVVTGSMRGEWQMGQERFSSAGAR